MQYLRYSLLAAALCAAPMAQAETADDSGWFFGLGAGLVTFDDSFDEVDPVNAYLRAGYGFNRYLEIGAEFSRTLSPDEIGYVEYDTDTNFLFVRGKLPLNDVSSLYAMAGVTRVNLTASVPGLNVGANDNGVGYGIGYQYRITKREYFAVDYVIYYDDDEFDGVAADITVDSLNFGFYGYF